MSNISIYKNSFDKIGNIVGYRKILEAVKEGKWSDVINSARKNIEEENQEEYDKIKLYNVPCVTFSGEFSKGQDSGLTKYTGLMCIDLDKLPPDQINLYCISFKEDKYIYSYFVSPSGKGIKILVRLSSSSEYHLQAYLSLENYFKTKYALITDPKCKNISRLCYVSYDPNLYINEDSEIWQVDTKFKTAGITSNEFDKRPEKFKGYVVSKDAKQAFTICIKWTERHHQYVDGNRNNYIHILACNLNRAGVFMQDSILLCHNEYPDLPLREVEQCIKSAYKRIMEHNTIDVYGDLESLPEHTEEEYGFTLEEGMIYNDTLELLKRGVKSNVTTKLIKQYGTVVFGFTQGKVDDLINKATLKFKGENGNVVEHKTAEEFLFDAVESFKDNGGVSTTILEFDEALNGGLMPGNFYGFIGKGKTFKSIFAQWIGVKNAKSGGVTLYLNGEMSILQLLDRLIEQELHIHLMQGLKDKTITKENISEINDKLKQVMKGNFEIVDGRGWTKQTILQTISDIEVNTGNKVNLCICDGLSQLEDTKKDEIKSAIFNSGELKEVAKTAECAVIGIMHTSSGIEAHIRDTSKFARGGDKTIANMDSMVCTSLLIDEQSSNFDNSDILYISAKFYARLIDKRGSGAVINKIIQVYRPLRLEPLDIEPGLMEISIK